MALLLALAEERDIILLDEWAADQDPHFRREFYQVLLPLMQEMGKTIFAISHDDHYFIHADRLLEMRNGQLSELTGEERDAASRDAVARRHNIDADLADCCRQVNILKIPSFLITL